MILWDLWFSFLLIGALSFGGGYAALPLIESAAVQQHGWLTEDALHALITISEVTPGPITLNAATFTGCVAAGIPGGIFATLGCILPSCVLVTLLACFWTRHHESTALQTVFRSVRPVVCGLILAAFMILALPALFGIPELRCLPDMQLNVVCCLLFVGSFLLLRTKKLPPVVWILFCGFCGVLLLP